MPADQMMVQGMAKVMVAEVNNIIATVARCRLRQYIELCTWCSNHR